MQCVVAPVAQLVADLNAVLDFVRRLFRTTLRMNPNIQEIRALAAAQAGNNNKLLPSFKR